MPLKPQEKKLLLGEVDRLLFLLKQSDAKENSIKIIKVCDRIVENWEKKQKLPEPPKQLDIYTIGNTIYVK